MHLPLNESLEPSYNTGKKLHTIKMINAQS